MIRTDRFAARRLVSAAITLAFMALALDSPVLAARETCATRRCICTKVCCHHSGGELPQWSVKRCRTNDPGITDDSMEEAQPQTAAGSVSPHDVIALPAVTVVTEAAGNALA